MRDWRLEEGHVHPDVNSFILWAHGQYLTGDSGYAGVPMTIEHNTILVDGKGQANEGNGHDAGPVSPTTRSTMQESRGLNSPRKVLISKAKALRPTQHPLG